MNSNYPIPCLNCKENHCDQSGSGYRRCSAWRTWFCWWWKRFPKMLTETKSSACDDKFRYAHPDTIIRYIMTSPCDSCSASVNCDKPCRAYLEWYDVRMEIFRKKWANEK